MPASTVSDFLRDLGFFTPPAADLDRLAGLTICDTLFFPKLEACAEAYEPWMPIYYLPIGDLDGQSLAIHLRPYDRESQRLAFLRAADESSLVEVAESPRALVLGALIRCEGWVNEEGELSDFDRGIETANSVFGTNFYKRGARGEFGSDESDRVLAAEVGPSAEYLLGEHLMADDSATGLRFLEQGISTGTRIMAFYRRAAEELHEEGRSKEAAAHCNSGLQCYHHTSYTSDLSDFYELARELLVKHPEAFDEHATIDLGLEGDKERLTFIAEQYDHGDVEWATKLLCDMCHRMEDYDSVLHLLRKHYEKLGWGWALKLCDLRSKGVSETTG